MSVLARIGDLIEEHDFKYIPYSKCTGCSICDEITSLRETLEPKKKATPKKKEEVRKPRKRYNEVKKEEVYEYIMQGLNGNQIAEKYGVPGFIISERISNWFPDYKQLKSEAAKKRLEKFDNTTLTHEIYKEMKTLNIPDKEISEHYGITKRSLEYKVAKWRKKKKAKTRKLEVPVHDRVDSLIQENANLEVQLHEKEITIQLLRDRIAELESGKKYKTVG